ncbi:MAG: autotransporter outer membrane beta-barrel domain-containing protein [Gemmatimonadota bacterium]|nr:autotransporter outer membrane beta-barrel domain-containing protein [Gemmatimonadota bacterium]
MINRPSSMERVCGLAVAAAVLGLAVSVDGIVAQQESVEDDSGSWSLSGYGVVNYFAFDWDTDPERRSAMDVERLVLYPGYDFGNGIRLDAEIEFEHGGTGVTKEFDKFEEFGEFETEVEAGGEVLLEQLNVRIDLKPWLNLRVGRLKVPFGIASVHDEPREYFRTTRSETEVNLVPTNWYENGIQLFGSLGATERWAYTLSVVNGLDATGFSSASWIVRGHQTRFETVNAENLAVAGRLEYRLAPGVELGLDGYRGNTTDNRPKPDLAVDAPVTVGSVHATLERGPWTVRALGLYGTLENSDDVSQANRNLSNNLNVKRTPVGSAASGYYAEAGFDLLSLADATDQRLDLFGRIERYDSMAEVEGDVFDNPRWQRTAYTVGLNYHLIRQVTFKTEFSHRELGTDEVEKTFSIGLGFEFGFEGESDGG